LIVDELKEIFGTSRFVQIFAAFWRHKGNGNLTAGLPAHEGKVTICEQYLDWF
jgi:hypothetical protein